MIKLLALTLITLSLSQPTTAQNFEALSKTMLSNPANVEAFGEDPKDYKFMFGVPSSKKGFAYIAILAAYKNESGAVESEEIQIAEIDQEAKKKANIAFVDMTLAGFEDMNFVKIPKEDRIKIEDAYIVYMKEEFRRKGKSFEEFAKAMLKKKDIGEQDKKFFNKVIRK